MTKAFTKETARNQIVDWLTDCQNADGTINEYWEDLHTNVFNSDYESYIYYNDARNDLNKFDVFDAIGIITKYEKEQFGDVNTDFSDPVKVANMLDYIVGDYTLNELVTAFEKEFNADLSGEMNNGDTVNAFKAYIEDYVFDESFVDEFDEHQQRVDNCKR